MINLKELSEEARAILKKTIPHNKEGHTSDEFMALYTDFLKETKLKYKSDSINGFQTAVARYGRIMNKELTEGENDEEIIIK
jgi:hypothetical protein